MDQALQVGVRARERGGDFGQFALPQLREQAALETAVCAAGNAAQGAEILQEPLCCRRRRRRARRLRLQVNLRACPEP